MPDAPLPPLPPVGQARWRTTADEVLRRLPPLAPAWWVAAAFAAVVLVIVGLVALRPAPAGPGPRPAVAPAAPEPPTPTHVGGSGRDGEPDEVVVDVSGAVVRPGLVRLRRGARVADAIASAGGLASGADATILNQARLLSDGEQVRVPKVGEPIPAPPPSPAPPGAKAGAPAVPVDLNHATVTELDVLPGVGPATAAAIVTWRQENGGFRHVDDLLEVPGIGPARLERLRPHVRV